jgi:hypothetical protein
VFQNAFWLEKMVCNMDLMTAFDLKYIFENTGFNFVRTL